MEFILNTALCQSPASFSKTQKAIDFIQKAMFYRCTQIDTPDIKNGIHHITIICTNNNLAETIQWKSRLGNNIKELNVRVLSSERKEHTFNNINNVIACIAKCKSLNHLPDILVMCTHFKRIEDICDLINSCSSFTNKNLQNNGIHEIQFTIMYDEADKNISTIVPLLDNADIMHESSPLKSIHFITATPFENFWKTLKKEGITELKSINNCEEIDRRDEDFQNILENYRGIDDHKYNFDIEDLTINTIDYASYVLPKIMENNKEALCIFAPASNTTKSHDKMRKLFQHNKFDVIILNGGDKSIYFFKDNKNITLNSFNNTHNIKGELRDTLRKYRELYPSNNVCITGNRVIERGITFCTNGFNFTDFIISMYHTKSISSLVQLFGRSCGDKKYANRMNIWCPIEVYNIVYKRIEICKRILSENPEFYNEVDFREKTKRESLEVCMTIPVLIDTNDVDYDEIIKKKKGNRWDHKYILQIIKKYNIDIYTKISEITIDQTSMPNDELKKGTETSYEKNIISIRDAIQKNKKWTKYIKKPNKKKDCYQVWLDFKNKKLYVSIFYGSRFEE